MKSDRKRVTVLELIKEVMMQGKEHDKKLAKGFREAFIKEYSEAGKFKELIESLGSDCADRLIFRLKREEKVDFYRDYVELKEIATKVRDEAGYQVFLTTCEENDARAWINDNGKWKELVFEALYKVFKQNEALKSFILA